jgi:hypothetical protein
VILLTLQQPVYQCLKPLLVIGFIANNGIKPRLGNLFAHREGLSFVRVICRPAYAERYPDLAARLVFADFFRAFAAAFSDIAANPCGISGASSPSSFASAFRSTSLGVSPVLSHRNKSGAARGPSRKLIGSFIRSVFFLDCDCDF